MRKLVSPTGGECLLASTQTTMCPLKLRFLHCSLLMMIELASDWLRGTQWNVPLLSTCRGFVNDGGASGGADADVDACSMCEASVFDELLGVVARHGPDALVLYWRQDGLIAPVVCPATYRVASSGGSKA